MAMDLKSNLRTPRGALFQSVLIGLMIWLCCATSPAHAAPLRILWWNASVTEPKAGPNDRKKIVDYLNRHENGAEFRVTQINSNRKGQFAGHLSSADYDMIIIDSTTPSALFNRADLDAFRGFYAKSGRRVMLDGTLWIRSTRYTSLSRFPGKGEVLGKFTLNQLEPFRDTGGILIGTDHDAFQTSANQALRAIIPDARFSGRTNPSRDGRFFGDGLLSASDPVTPIDILRHWESIPSQAETPVGNFVDFMGNPVTLYSLVETSDKPGRKRKRPYISANFDPGQDSVAIDSKVLPDKPKDRMPTRKSPPKN